MIFIINEKTYTFISLYIYIYIICIIKIKSYMTLKTFSLYIHLFRQLI